MNLPVDYRSMRPASLTESAGGGIGGLQPPRISIDSNVFTLIDGAGNERRLPPLIVNGQNGQEALVALDVIVVEANPKPSKMYWGRDYNPSDVNPPLCFSDNGSAPSMTASSPQSATCAACPHNVIGSAVSKFSGAKIKACHDMKKLAVVVPSQPGMVFLFTVKPGSFKNFQSMLGWLRGYKMPNGSSPDLCDVILRLSFESQGVLQFTPIGLTEWEGATGALVGEAWQKKAALAQIVGSTDEPIAALPAPAAVAAIGRAISATGTLQGASTQPLPPPPPPPPPPNPAQAPQSFGAPLTGAAPAVGAAEPAKRKRRTKAEMQAAAGATPVTGLPPGAGAASTSAAPFVSGLQQAPTGAPVADGMEIPPFLRRDPPPATPTPQLGFGIEQGQAPDAALQARLDEAFKLPT